MLWNYNALNGRHICVLHPCQQKFLFAEINGDKLNSSIELSSVCWTQTMNENKFINPQSNRRICTQYDACRGLFMCHDPCNVYMHASIQLQILNLVSSLKCNNNYLFYLMNKSTLCLSS